MLDGRNSFNQCRRHEHRKDSEIQEVREVTITELMIPIPNLILMKAIMIHDELEWGAGRYSVLPVIQMKLNPKLAQLKVREEQSMMG